MKKLLILILGIIGSLVIIGCATKLIVIERDAKGTIRTIEAEDYSIKTPTLIAVPSRWLTPTFVSEIFKGIIGWQSILPAVMPSPAPVPLPPQPGPTPVPTPVPGPIPPYPAPEPTPIPVPIPTASTVFSQTGNVITQDMNTLPGSMRQAGFSGRDNALFYAITNIYRRGPGPELSVKEGDSELARLNQQREAIYKWYDAEVMKVKSTLMTYPAMTVIAITNDAYDRLGCRLGPAIVDRLKEFGNRVMLGNVLPEP